ncbi:hypothetical protein GC176_00530 [bacterium]|nr:hypothetical protein [bacterium]
MNLLAQIVCTAVGYCLMTARAILLIALVPSWFDQAVTDERLQLIAVALSFAALLYSNSLLQSAELTLINARDVCTAWRLLRERFAVGTRLWHRDLLLLNLLSGCFGAGVAINLQISQSLTRREGRLTAIVIALIVWSGIVLLYRGTGRFQLKPPISES